MTTEARHNGDTRLGPELTELDDSAPTLLFPSRPIGPLTPDGGAAVPQQLPDLPPMVPVRRKRRPTRTYCSGTQKLPPPSGYFATKPEPIKTGVLTRFFPQMRGY